MQSGFKTRHGIVVFILSLLSIASAGFFLQMTLGIYGLALTELLIILFAVIPVIIFKTDFTDVFPVKIPRLRHITGSLLIWSGTYLIVLLITQVTMYFFPEGFLEVADNISEFSQSSSLPVLFIIVAFLPAICEEMLHRGFIQHTFRSQRKWQRVLFMGLIFGVFHLDPYRFIPTFLLGMAFSYAMIETNNLFIPMIMHFTNNALAVYFSNFEGDANTINQNQMLVSIGIICVLASATPFLILWGAKLLSGQRKKVFTKSKAGMAAALSIMLILVGGLTISSFEMNQDPLFVTNISMAVNHKSSAHSLPINVERADVYELNLAVEIEEGFVVVSITDEYGLEIYKATAQQLTLTREIDLVPGNYLFGIEYLFEDDIEGYAHCLINVEIK